MIKAIDNMKKSHQRMTTILNELETLEDGEDVDYTNAVFTYRKLVSWLEHRREVLQRRGRKL